MSTDGIIGATVGIMTLKIAGDIMANSRKSGKKSSKKGSKKSGVAFSKIKW